MKVLHLPQNVGSNPWNLSRGERMLGLESDTLAIDENWLGYSADVQLNIQNKSSIAKLAALGKALFDVRDKYDVYHFNFGRSLFHFPGHGIHNWDLGLYAKGKKKFVTYQGCDARQKYLTMQRTKIAPCHQSDCYGGQCNSGKLDEMRRKGIERMSSFVDYIWAVNPDLLYFLPEEKASFLPYAVIEPKEQLQPPPFHDPLVFAHAPTNRAGKGTSFVISAFEKLEKKYPNQLKLVLIENLPHKQALKVYREADVLIDQLLTGWYGAVAVECMYLAKPVVARIASEDLHFIPGDMAKHVQETVIHAEPDTILEVLENLVNNRSVLRERAAASREFANRWHSPVRVAEVTKAQYES